MTNRIKWFQLQLQLASPLVCNKTITDFPDKHFVHMKIITTESFLKKKT